MLSVLVLFRNYSLNLLNGELLVTGAWWAVRRYEHSYWAPSVKKRNKNRIER